MMYVFTSQCQFTRDNYILKSFLLDIVAQEHKYGLNVWFGDDALIKAKSCSPGYCV